MGWFKGYYFLLITVVYFTYSSGQLCEESDLVISAVTERGLSLTWTLGSSPFVVETEPKPCDPGTPVANYGCQCEEDTSLNLNHTVSDFTTTVEYLFPGRLYEFRVHDNTGQVVAIGCTHTVPRKPNLFTFDDAVTPNPKTDAISVIVKMPLVTEPSCNPDQQTEYSNSFDWSAENVNGGQPITYTERDVEQEDGEFRFQIQAQEFDPGQEYELYIKSTRGSAESEYLPYALDDGTFKTALPSVTGVRKAEEDGYPSWLLWDHVNPPELRAYLVICNSTKPWDYNYSDETNERVIDIEDLNVGHEFSCTVETYLPGYKQEVDPTPVTVEMKPKPPTDIIIDHSNVTSVTLLWTDPTAFKNDNYFFNITVTGMNCDPETHCFCGCNAYGNGNFNTTETRVTIPNLYSGRKYAFEIKTVTDGPLHSDTANEEAYTAPRSPSVQISEDQITTTTIPFTISVTKDCQEATEVLNYKRHIRNSHNEWHNETIDCTNDDTTHISDIVDLNPGEIYNVCTYINIGPSYSDPSCYDDIKTKINAPVISTLLEDDNTTIAITWDLIEGEIDEIMYICESAQGVNRSGTAVNNATSAECTDITPGALYSVTVDSIKAGFEQYGDPLQNQLNIRPHPVKPIFNVNVDGTSSINISWTVTGHLDVIKYQIEGNETVVPVADGHTVINDNLEPNGMYSITLWGVAGFEGDNDFEATTRKELVNFQMYSAEVDGLIINLVNGSTFEITWNEPLENAAEVGLNHYIVQLWDLSGCAETIIMDNTEMDNIEIDGLCGRISHDNFNESPITLTVTDTEPCTNYTIDVIPVNTIGNGGTTSDVKETDIFGPSEPVALVMSKNSTEIYLSWNKPEPLSCLMSTDITFEYTMCENGDIITVEDTLEEEYQYRFRNLQPHTDHNVSIKVYNEAGFEEEFVIVKTLSSEPGKPTELEYHSITHDKADITWEPVDRCEENGNIVAYLLRVCSTDKIQGPENCGEYLDIGMESKYTLTDLDPYFTHKCMLKARNTYDGTVLDGEEIEDTFDTQMWYPDRAAVDAKANCDELELKITPPIKLNGPLKGYRVVLSNGASNNHEWTCTESECDTYKDGDGILILSQDEFTGNVVLNKDATYTIECTINNTDYGSVTDSDVNVVCPDAGSDVGLIVGLTCMSIAIIIIVLGLIFAKMKGIGPFRDSDDGFNYLDAQSIGTDVNTPNNHAMVPVGTDNTAFTEDNIEVVISSRPIQIDQFEAYHNDILGDSQYTMAEQFGVIKTQSPVHEGIECRRPENKPKNRYTNILPFDWSLVKLKTRIGVPFSEYINATYIPGEWGKDEYIATQGPVTETVDDFWRMVWEQETPIVIMLTVFVQNNKAKCVMYWPEAGSTMVCGDILVTTKSSDSWGYDDQYRTREIHLKCNDQVRVITQYQMVEWPDYGCPDSPDELLDLVETVRLQCPDDRMTRLVVHCSAGVGRTGTYIAVDRLRQQLDNKEPTDTIDIQAMISEMREYRPHMVQTEAQYTYIHDCVNAMLLRKHGQNVDNGEVDIYENTDYPRKVSAESTESDQPTMSGAMPYPIKVSADSTDSDKPTMSGTMSMSVIV